MADTVAPKSTVLTDVRVRLSLCPLEVHVKSIGTGHGLSGDHGGDGNGPTDMKGLPEPIMRAVHWWHLV